MVEALSKGEKEPGANAKHYFGWTPQEIHQTLGKPDWTSSTPKTGQPGLVLRDARRSVSLQVRFEAGIVIGVWP